jgi:hypothetical protein
MFAFLHLFSLKAFRSDENRSIRYLDGFKKRLEMVYNRRQIAEGPKDANTAVDDSVLTLDGICCSGEF